ncbi:Signal transduction histidine kinase [Pseudobutyrivibrio sp. NOR37]|uniref:histidine kinase n=1 Tax=Pseudobutyrivibrio xylanivorans TaxID=185007 RepID=A0A6M0LM91_PSEXY|nr:MULTISPECIES: HAMP domain-containing sensor histidine kinase [Pseudobutyrivibrio]NEX01971.1 HAMP domain-containing histidine kinase [Pseudobutyrivibrio xylanivorans]SFR73172.1 Signal transduction histidine kinase [Pseudobutyrivibrio sp. NOR37]
MRPYLKYISKQFSRLILLLCALVVINIIIFITSFYKIVNTDYAESSPLQVLSAIQSDCNVSGISDSAKNILNKYNIWAIYLDLEGNVVWNHHAPSDISDKYSINDIAVISKGYLNNYPVFIHTNDDGLLLLGYPKDSYVKLQSNFFSIRAIKRFPIFLLVLLLFDLAIIILIYLHSKNRFISKINPIIEGIESLAAGKTINLEEKGQLSEVAESVNRASYVINRQNEARVNWISGVSHDIRTPLSLILGYSDKIKNQPQVNDEILKYADIIGQNSIRIKDLVADLNLFSMLEYNMQPLELSHIRISKLLRSFVADKINEGLDAPYSISLEIDPSAEQLEFDCNERLIERALSNLVNNSIRHNPNGCDITVELHSNKGKPQIIVTDNGVGVSREFAEAQKKPHYFEALDERLDLRHGLGLIIVKQITEAHGGTVDTPEVSTGYKTILSF